MRDVENLEIFKSVENIEREFSRLKNALSELTKENYKLRLENKELDEKNKKLQGLVNGKQY